MMFYIDAMLNFDGDIDANANIKCEHTVTGKEAKSTIVRHGTIRVNK